MALQRPSADSIPALWNIAVVVGDSRTLTPPTRPADTALELKWVMTRCAATKEEEQAVSTLQPDTKVESACSSMKIVCLVFLKFSKVLNHQL